MRRAAVLYRNICQCDLVASSGGKGEIVSKVCELCGKRPVAGRKYARRGLAKSKGGVGRKITGKTKRKFRPNIQKIRVRTDEGSVLRVKVCTKCLKTGLRRGTLLKATRKPRPPRHAAPTQSAPTPVVQEKAPENAPGAQQSQA